MPIMAGHANSPRRSVGDFRLEP